MERSYERRRAGGRLAVVASGVAITVTAAGVGLAVADPATGTIDGCYQSKTGSLRVLQAEETCSRNETPLSWNQTGPAGPEGPAGPSGVLANGFFQGRIPTISNGAFVYVFAGPTTRLTAEAGQRLLGAASVPVAPASGETEFRLGLCFRHPTSGAITPFAGGYYVKAQADGTRVAQAAVGAVNVPNTATYEVGACILNTGAFPLSDNDYVNGWVMVAD